MLKLTFKKTLLVTFWWGQQERRCTTDRKGYERTYAPYSRYSFFQSLQPQQPRATRWWHRLREDPAILPQARYQRDAQKCRLNWFFLFVCLFGFFWCVLVFKQSIHLYTLGKQRAGSHPLPPPGQGRQDQAGAHTAKIRSYNVLKPHGKHPLGSEHSVSVRTRMMTMPPSAPARTTCFPRKLGLFLKYNCHGWEPQGFYSLFNLLAGLLWSGI